MPELTPHDPRPVLAASANLAALATQLNQIGVPSQALPSVREVIARLGGGAERIYAAILLDGAGKGADLCEECASLRAANIHLPIIVIADPTNPASVGWLNAGVDAVTSLTSPQVLAAQIRALIRRFDEGPYAFLQIGHWELQPASRELTRDDSRGRTTRLRLTDLESKILARLWRARGEQVTRQTLLQDVWGANERTTSHTLETHIYRLRQKIELDPKTPKIIITGARGYSMVTEKPKAFAATANTNHDIRRAA